MFDYTIHNNIYDSLWDSISEYNDVCVNLVKDDSTLTSFTDYMSQNESVFSKFTKVTEELCAFLYDYDFSYGMMPMDMQRKLQALLSLWQRMTKMDEEAQKLESFPDYCGSKEAVDESCRLKKTIFEQMALVEVDHYARMVDTKTAKLFDIQVKMANEKKSINAFVEENLGALNRFKMFQAELRQYVDGFPHSGVDDWEEVRKRVAAAGWVETRFLSVGKTIESVSGYCDRYHQGEMVARYETIVREAGATMRFADVGNTMSQLDEVEKQAQEVASRYREEGRELLRLRSELMEKKPDLWKEDNKRILGLIDGIVEQGPANTQYDLQQLKKMIDDARRGRATTIQSAMKNNKWLSKWPNKIRHDALVSRYISSAYYLKSLDEMRRERKKDRVVLSCIFLGVLVAIVLIVMFISKF